MILFYNVSSIARQKRTDLTSLKATTAIHELKNTNLKIQHAFVDYLNIKEAEYAFKLIMQPGHKPDGWLGNLTNTNTCIFH